MNSELLSNQATRVSAAMKQLAHPVRLKILCSLVDGEKTVSEIVEYCGASQSWVSQFLGRMKLGGIVEARKDGIYARYRISDQNLKELMKAVHRIYCGTKGRK